MLLPIRREKRLAHGIEKAETISRRLALALAGCALMGCSAILQNQKSQHSRDSTWLSLLGSRYPCRSGAIAVVPTASAMHCTLAMASLHEIAMGRGVEFGVAAADTARVTEIELFDRNYGKPDGLYWIANVTVKGSETGLIVLFERTRQRITVTHGEDWGIPK